MDKIARRETPRAENALLLRERSASGSAAVTSLKPLPHGQARFSACLCRSMVLFCGVRSPSMACTLRLPITVVLDLNLTWPTRTLDRSLRVGFALQCLDQFGIRDSDRILAAVRPVFHCGTAYLCQLRFSCRRLDLSSIRLGASWRNKEALKLCGREFGATGLPPPGAFFPFVCRRSTQARRQGVRRSRWSAR
jgi:hypothetical protein